MDPPSTPPWWSAHQQPLAQVTLGQPKPNAATNPHQYRPKPVAPNTPKYRTRINWAQYGVGSIGYSAEERHRIALTYRTSASASQRTSLAMEVPGEAGRWDRRPGVVSAAMRRAERESEYKQLGRGRDSGMALLDRIRGHTAGADEP
jgi:hypothetical protein